MSCHEIRSLMPLLADEELLEPEEWDRAHAHLETCEPCRRERAELALAVDRVDEEPSAPPPEVWATVKAAIPEDLVSRVQRGAAAELSGTVVAGYRLGDELRRDLGSVCYRATGEDDDQAVALRFVFAASPRHAERFLREARAAAAVDHPGVVRVLDYGVEQGLPYVVYEWVEGPTLKERFEAGRRMPLAEALKLTLQLAQSLQAVHTLGIVHRDLKPERVYLEGGLGERARLDLFAPEPVEDAMRLTRCGAAIGTPDYMPPEQLTGRGVDPRSDLYSLGVLFYELLTGHLPFQGETMAELARAILEGRPPSPEAHVPGLPAGYQAVLGRLLQRDAEQRYPDAAALIADLEALEWGQPVEETSEPPWAEPRGRTLRTIAIALGLGFLIGVVLALLFAL